MIWTISGYKQFKKCQRQWYYNYIVADARVKNDSYRREVTILSKLQSIYAWRGSVVDDIVSRLVVNAINKKMPINKEYFLNEAQMAFDKQLEYAVFQKYREPQSKLGGDENFAALLEYDFKIGISDKEIDKAKQDVNDALTNLLDNKDFFEYLKGAKLLISQRPLMYSFDRFTVKAIPDLIVFFDNEPPHIFDWKVHTFGTVSYDEQLISYAIALYKVANAKPHVDFPKGLNEHKVFDYKLTEYQLLHESRIKRDYEVTLQRIEDLGSNISGSIIEMYMAGAHKKYNDLEPERFSTTMYIENCHSCAFKGICKQNDYETRN